MVRSAVAAAVLLTLGLVLQPMVRAAPPTLPPGGSQSTGLTSLLQVVHVYHRLAADADLRNLDFTASAIPSILIRTRREIEAMPDIGPQLLVSDRVARDLSASGKMSQLAKIALLGTAVDELLLLLPPGPLAERLRDATGLMQFEAHAIPVGDVATRARAYADLDAAARRYGLGPDPLLWLDSDFLPRPPAPFVTFAGVAAAKDYATRCADEKVPAPPKWTDRNAMTGWRKIENLTGPKHLFVSKKLTDVELWAAPGAPGPAGICLALPRRKMAGAKIELLGVICQSKETGKTCFWDNMDSAGNKLLDPDTTDNIVKDWINADNKKIEQGGGNKCVNCHRGRNAYIIHPEAKAFVDLKALRATFPTAPDKRYEPISDLGWTNPAATPPTKANEGCSECHEIGDTTTEKRDYCAILKQAANVTMPDEAGPATWTPAAGTPYFDDLKTLRMNCAP